MPASTTWTTTRWSRTVARQLCSVCGQDVWDVPLDSEWLEPPEDVRCLLCLLEPLAGLFVRRAFGFEQDRSQRARRGA